MQEWYKFHADISSLAHFQPFLRTLVGPISEHALRFRPAPSEWSVIENIGHLIDTEQLLRYRIQRMCALEHPIIISYDQDAAIVRNQYQQAILTDLLATLDRERHLTLTYLDTLSAADLLRTGWHNEFGLWRVDFVVSYLARHDYLHDQQIRGVLNAYH
ncbi:MAG: DinB family protein [Roseiflexaceae bacterium]